MAPQAILKLQIPKYSKKEEQFNCISHLLGFVFGLFILIFFPTLGIVNNLSFGSIVSLIIYALSMMILYFSSSVYHGLENNGISKKILRIIDHCTIFILIAGTYTPICVISFGLHSYGLIILIIEWLGAILGIVLNIYNLKNIVVRIISIFLYLILGWLILIMPNVFNLLTQKAFIFILAGGIVYSLGVIFYAIGHNKKWFHSIFHVFCVLATLLQAVGIYLLIMA